MESICPGYNQIMIKTVNRYDGALGHIAGDLYYIISRTERDRVVQESGSVNLALLASYDGRATLYTQMNLDAERPFISFPAWSLERLLYLENNNIGQPQMLAYGIRYGLETMALAIAAKMLHPHTQIGS